MSELFVGVDVGGTTVKLGICGVDGVVRARSRIATDPEATPDDMLGRIAHAILALTSSGNTVRACGVGTPGPLASDRRTLSRANHLPTWSNVAIPDILGARLALPVVLENDGNCAAWGESIAGEGRDARAIVLFTLGTGVGGGIVLDGELWSGAGGAAGAFGHIVVDPHGPQCLCGQHGCLEQFASATSVARRFGRGSAIDAFRAAASGDPEGQAAVDAACHALALAIADTIHVLQPDLVLLGGGMAAAGDALLAPVRAGVKNRVRSAWLVHTRIALAALGDDAGWIGAALWAAHRTMAARATAGVIPMRGA